jgi:pimeloyl-ACP methyl ester carboxylesterase
MTGKVHRILAGALLATMLTMQAPTPVMAQKLQVHVQKYNRANDPGLLVPYNNEELGDQTPLILVHGIGGNDEGNYCNWDRFLKFAERDAKFEQRFKVYLYKYDTSQSVPNLSEDLKNDLTELITSQGNRKVRVLAYSEGGLLYRNAMRDPYIMAHTEKVITIATPHHGSPLASTSWLREELKDNSLLSPVRMTSRISYLIAKAKYPTFEKDFAWDNFDGAIAGDQVVSDNAIMNDPVYLESLDKKLITYGSYFGTGRVVSQQLSNELGIELVTPKERSGIRNFFSKHLIFSLVRKNIADMPIAAQEAAIAGIDGATADKAIRPLMVYNDGISPISSTLWLGRFLPKLSSVKNPAKKLWVALKGLQGTQTARLFPALDHKDWMEGTTRANSKQVSDMLHPEDKAKTVFEWFIHDLMAS